MVGPGPGERLERMGTAVGWPSTQMRRSNRSRQDLRDARDRVVGCSGRAVVIGEVVVVEGDGGGHDAVALAGDAVAAGAGDLGDEAVAAEPDDEPGGSFALSPGLVTVGGPRR
jgi:hypothetical protein